MDTISAAEAARQLKTSIPRVKRALAQLEAAPQQTRRSGRVQITPAQMERLGRVLGRVPKVDDLSRVEVLALAALARSPRGLLSARAVARRAGISPTSAAAAIRTLTTVGLVRSKREWVAAGRAIEVEVLRAAVDSPRWASIAPLLAQVELVTPTVAREGRVPRRLRHLFWNTAPAQLEVATGAAYIARRLLTTGDSEGLAWGANNLPAHAWLRAAEARGLHPADRALALNLAEAAHDAS